jgi:hypothetical protein
MMASTEGRAFYTIALGDDVSELKELYRRLLRAIDCGQLEVARHLMNVIDAQQSQTKGLSDEAQEAFDRLAIAATTEDSLGVREALDEFRSVLRSHSTMPPSGTITVANAPSSPPLAEESRPSGVSPRFEFKDYSFEAFDQELPDTASPFALKRF